MYSLVNLGSWYFTKQNENTDARVKIGAEVFGQKFSKLTLLLPIKYWWRTG